MDANVKLGTDPYEARRTFVPFHGGRVITWFMHTITPLTAMTHKDPADDKDICT